MVFPPDIRRVASLFKLVYQTKVSCSRVEMAHSLAFETSRFFEVKLVGNFEVSAETDTCLLWEENLAALWVHWRWVLGPNSDGVIRIDV